MGTKFSFTVTFDNTYIYFRQVACLKMHNRQLQKHTKFWHKMIKNLQLIHIKHCQMYTKIEHNLL